MDPASPPQRLTLELVLAALPAVAAAVFAAASAAVNALSGARRAALSEALTGRAQRSLERYVTDGATIESRWLVLRVLGISSAALLVGRRLPPSLGGWAPLVAALLALIAYGVPAEIGRSVTSRRPERAAPFLLGLLRPLELVVAPLAAPMVWLGGLIGRSVTPAPGASTPKITETEVELIVNEGELNGSLDHEQSEMIRNVLDFGELTAGELMVPRTQVTGVDVELTPAELLDYVTTHGHSRYPVYRDSIDNVIGVLHVKDLIQHLARESLHSQRIEELMRKPVSYVTEVQSASAVLRDMRALHQHLAVVTDEFGGVGGIVTLEDLLEEIVGDIRDEHDEDEAPIVDLGGGRLMVDASVPIGEISRYLGAELPEDGDYYSLGGYLVSALGRVPGTGASLSAHGLEFIVREADARRITKVEIVRPPPSSEGPSPRSSRMSVA